MGTVNRQPYLDQIEAEHTAYLLGEQTGHQVLCTWCRYFHYSPPSYEETYGEAECLHPIDRVHDYESERAFDGGDCWGFRPEAGASDQWNRRLPNGHTRQVLGPRLMELIALGPEGQAELLDQHYARERTTWFRR